MISCVNTRCFGQAAKLQRSLFDVLHEHECAGTPGVYPFKAWRKWEDGSELWFNEPRCEGVEAPFPTVTVEEAVESPSPTDTVKEGGDFLPVGMVQIGSTAIALCALTISLYSIRSRQSSTTA